MPPSYPIRSTPFPSHLLDAVMPTLRDTEWRLLCVIVRQTLGWQETAGENAMGRTDGQDGTGRKVRDWLTHSQLKARTGRSGEAVSHALDALVRRGLVEVGDEDGNALATPKARRRHAGRLYFRLAPEVLDGTELALLVLTGETDAFPTEVSMTKSGIRIAETEEATPKSETRTLESEVGIPKTTKETGDKTEEAATSYSASSPSVENPRPNPPLPASTALAGDRDKARFLRLYRDRFRKRSSRGEPPPLSWGKDGALTQRLLDVYGYERLSQLLDTFFASDDAWAKRCGYSLAAFQHLLPKLIMDGGAHTPRQEKATALVIHGPSAAWAKAAEVGASGGRASLFEQYPDLAHRVRGQPP